MPDEKTPLEKARNILTSAFGDASRHEPEPFVPPEHPLEHAKKMLSDAGVVTQTKPRSPPVSTGVTTIDDLVGGGYPSGRFTRVGARAKHLQTVTNFLVRAIPTPVTLVTTRGLPDEFPENVELVSATSETALRELWDRIDEDGPRVLVLDDIKFGVPAGKQAGQIKKIWGDALPRLKSRLYRNGVALVAFTALDSKGEFDDGQAWRVYPSITAVFESGMLEDTYVVTFMKCTVAPTQGMETTVALT